MSDFKTSLIAYASMSILAIIIAIPCLRIKDRISIANHLQTRKVIVQQLHQSGVTDVEKANAYHAVIEYNSWLSKSKYWKNFPVAGWFKSSKFNDMKLISTSL